VDHQGWDANSRQHVADVALVPLDLERTFAVELPIERRAGAYRPDRRTGYCLEALYLVYILSMIFLRSPS
jgi:hypothetical protein